MSNMEWSICSHLYVGINFMRKTLSGEIKFSTTEPVNSTIKPQVRAPEDTVPTRTFHLGIYIKAMSYSPYTCPLPPTHPPASSPNALISLIRDGTVERGHAAVWAVRNAWYGLNYRVPYFPKSGLTFTSLSSATSSGSQKEEKE
jgi:hypothetical protein